MHLTQKEQISQNKMDHILTQDAPVAEKSINVPVHAETHLLVQHKVK